VKRLLVSGDDVLARCGTRVDAREAAHEGHKRRTRLVELRDRFHKVKLIGRPSSPDDLK
jgi:hypothetical protein